MIEIICFIFLLGIMYVFFLRLQQSLCQPSLAAAVAPSLEEAKDFLAAAAAVVPLPAPSLEEAVPFLAAAAVVAVPLPAIK